MRRGFSLLEVVVALAILALSLMAVFSLNSGAVANHTYTKKLTVAALLARGKMIDLEQKLYDEGLPSDDDEESGDFSDEGWPAFKWRAKIIAPKTSGLDERQLMSAVFNVPMGEGGASGALGGSGDVMNTLSYILSGATNTSGNIEGLAEPWLGVGQGAQAARGAFMQMVEQLANAVREVHLTVSWRDGTQVESVDLVTHVVSLGPGSDRNGQIAGAPMPGADGQVWVRQDNGAQVKNPVDSPQGGKMDPTDNSPLMLLENYQRTHGGGAAGAPTTANPNSIFNGPAKSFFPAGMGLPSRGPFKQ